jgi:L-fuconolactonase
MTESRFRIDSHQHFWTTRRQDYNFLTPERPTLWRDYLPTDLEPHLVRHGFDASVVVQAAQSEAETDWLLDLVADVPFVWGVVGWLDFAAPPETFRRALRRLQQRPKFVGLRPMLQDLRDDAWIRRPEVLRNLRWVADEGIPFDILVYPRHLPHVVAALEEVPHLHAVLDHLGKPPIASGVLEPWGQWVARLAAFPDVWCKLSGMVTEADWAHWKPEDMMPYVHHVVTVFGAGRVMFGSDWPVCLQAATYDQVVELATATLPGTLGHAERAAIFGDNARRFYRLRTPAESIS